MHHDDARPHSFRIGSGHGRFEVLAGQLVDIDDPASADAGGGLGILVLHGGGSFFVVVPLVVRAGIPSSGGVAPPHSLWGGCGGVTTPPKGGNARQRKQDGNKF